MFFHAFSVSAGKGGTITHLRFYSLGVETRRVGQKKLKVSSETEKNGKGGKYWSRGGGGKKLFFLEGNNHPTLHPYKTSVAG